MGPTSKATSSRDQGEAKIVSTFTSEEFASHALSLLTSLQRIAKMKGETNLSHLIEPARMECAAIIARGEGKEILTS